MPRHFLHLKDLAADELLALLARASELRKMHHEGKQYRPFVGKTLAMLFEKSSTRTRVSFEAGMAQLGGHAIFLSPRDTHLGRGEPIEDSARVISRMADCVMIRTFDQEILERFAKHSKVPVINGLSDLYHPCQLLADLQTWQERHGNLKGLTAAWIGDGNNVCHSFINAAGLLDFNLRIASPKDYEPDAKILSTCEQATLVESPEHAAQSANLIVTDVWTSMGQEKQQSERTSVFLNYQVTQEIMRLADKEAIFMHCLPAHRGEEVTADVIDGPQSAVWDEAENRLHAQKALLEFLLTK